jgi:hypothetical protein
VPFGWHFIQEAPAFSVYAAVICLSVSYFGVFVFGGLGLRYFEPKGIVSWPASVLFGLTSALVTWFLALLAFPLLLGENPFTAPSPANGFFSILTLAVGAIGIVVATVFWLIARPDLAS